MNSLLQPDLEKKRYNHCGSQWHKSKTFGVNFDPCLPYASAFQLSENQIIWRERVCQAGYYLTWIIYRHKYICVYEIMSNIHIYIQASCICKSVVHEYQHYLVERAFSSRFYLSMVKPSKYVQIIKMNMDANYYELLLVKQDRSVLM